MIKYIFEDKLAGMHRPGRINNIKQDLNEITQNNFNVIISLYDPKDYQEKSFAFMNLEDFGIEHYSFVFPDFDVPDEHVIIEAIKLIEQKINNENKKVVIHCGAGCGRTGTLAAIYLRYKHKNMSGKEIIKQLRQNYDKCAIETPFQEQFVINWSNWPNISL